MAIIIPNQIHLRHALQAKGIKSDATLAALCHDPVVQDLVVKECNAIGKKSGFKGQELLQAVVLTADEWTPENGLVTAAQKIQRSKIAKSFRDEINVRNIFLSTFLLIELFFFIGGL
jgi:long-chain acyl-CoA synthetase